MVKDIDKLKEQELTILENRENLKNEIRELTKRLYNTRQKMRYKDTVKNSSLQDMFGKTLSQLTTDELREYNKAMKQKSRNKKV